MSTRRSFRWLLVPALFLGGVLTWLLTTTLRVSAQCETPPKSSCLACHAQGNHLSGMGEWNAAHIRQDMCVACHGGNGSAPDEKSAHAGITAQPLSDVYTDCHSCHPADYLARSAQFAAVLNVTPGSCATPTSAASVNNTSGRPPGNIHLPSSPWSPFAIVMAGLASLAAFFLALIWLDRHKLEG